MKKIFFSLLIFLLTTFVSLFPIYKYVYAATLQLTKIGALDTTGKNYPEWWYTEVNPLLTGTAAENSEVTITIRSQQFKAATNAQGVWSYQTTLEKGDFDISISQGQSRISFKLHVGQNLPSGSSTGSVQTGSAQGQTPNTGFNQLVSIGFGLGVVFLATYFYILGDPRRKSVFEAKILKED